MSKRDIYVKCIYGRFESSSVSNLANTNSCFKDSFFSLYNRGDTHFHLHVDRVLALHAGSRGFDSHRGHMSERFFRPNRPANPHPVSSELENIGIRVAVGD